MVVELLHGVVGKNYRHRSHWSYRSRINKWTHCKWFHHTETIDGVCIFLHGGHRIDSIATPTNITTAFRCERASVVFTLKHMYIWEEKRHELKSSSYNWCLFHTELFIYMTGRAKYNIWSLIYFISLFLSTCLYFFVGCLIPMFWTFEVN